MIQVERCCLAFFTTVWFDHFSFPEMCTPRILTFLTVDEDGGVPSLVPSEVHNCLLCFSDVEGMVVYLSPHHQSTYLLPGGHLVVVGNQAYYCRVVTELDDGVGTL